MVPYSADIREASPCIRWKQIQKPQTDTMFRVRDLGMLSLLCITCIKYLHLEGLGNLVGEEVNRLY